MDERQTNGQFAPGHHFAKGGARRGAGRKPEEWRRMYRRACTSAVDEQDIEQAVAGVRDRAKSGDANAAKLFFAIVSTMAQEPTERAQVTVDVVLRALPAEFREAVRAELAALLSAGGGSGGGGASGR